MEASPDIAIVDEEAADKLAVKAFHVHGERMLAELRAEAATCAYLRENLARVAFCRARKMVWMGSGRLPGYPRSTRHSQRGHGVRGPVGGV